MVIYSDLDCIPVHIMMFLFGGCTHVLYVYQTAGNISAAYLLHAYVTRFFWDLVQVSGGYLIHVIPVSTVPGTTYPAIVNTFLNCRVSDLITGTYILRMYVGLSFYDL